MTIDVLLTGFAPFDGAARNESWDAVRLAAAALTDNSPSSPLSDSSDESDTAASAGAASPTSTPLSVQILELPVEFGAAGDALVAAVRDHRPRLAIAVGLAAGRRAITPERVAINIQDARIPDNAGEQPVDRPVVAGGPVGYFSTLPVKAMVHAVHTGLDLSASVSQTAGTFVCNDVFYRLQHELATSPGPTRGGFIHVPAHADLAVEDTARALAHMIRTALTTDTDLQVTGGSVH